MSVTEKSEYRHLYSFKIPEEQGKLNDIKKAQNSY